MTEYVMWLKGYQYEFIIEQGELSKATESHDIRRNPYSLLFDMGIDYAQLLQRPLSLSMFIPTDEKGEPMEKPMDWDLFVQRYGTDKRIEGLKKDFAFEFQVFLKYQKALDKVKFSGWEKGSSAVELTEEGFYLKYNGDDTLAFWSVDNQEFELKIGGAFNTIETIEKLINLGCILTLTEACKKQLGL